MMDDGGGDLIQKILRQAEICRAERLTIKDPWDLLISVDSAYWPHELFNRRHFYPRFIELLARESSPGMQDILLAQARRVFRCTVRGARQDLKRVDEIQRLESVYQRPAKTPRARMAP